MTVIVLDTDESYVVLAADQQWLDDSDLVFFAPKIQKIYNRNRAVIGAIATAGDGKKGLLFESFILEKFRKAPSAKDTLLTLNEACASFTGDITDTLMVVHGRGYHIDESGLVLPKVRWAIGSGGLVAIGAMWTRRGTAERLATFGCRAAIALTAGCGGQIDVFSMPRV